VSIHPTSVISKDAEIGENVTIGPFCVVKGRVKIGAGTVLESHVSLGNEHGLVEIGKDNVLSAGAAVGGAPQDLSYKGEPTRLILGDRNRIREFATLNCGTMKGGEITRVGSDCLIMAYAHIAHDCQVGDHCVIANSTQLAGHVVFEDHVKVGGMCAFNQFIRVGKHAFIAGDSSANKDILPFTIAQGRYAVMRAPNSIGMERSGYTKEEVDAVKLAVRIVTKGKGTVDEALVRIQNECAPVPAIAYFVEFIKASVAGPRGLAI
jgi:UDP-N-acetylglucosamine acyltransferase